MFKHSAPVSDILALAAQDGCRKGNRLNAQRVARERGFKFKRYAQAEHTPLYTGMLIGLGAVLPGISRAVLCVIFGIYQRVMELLSSPFKNFRTHIPKLIPVLLGAAAGFLGVAKLLAFLLEAYPDHLSACLWGSSRAAALAVP